MEVASSHLPSWEPSLSLLRTGKAFFINPYTKNEEKLEWTFEVVKTALPISYTICKMTISGICVSGFGDSLFLKFSMVQSFAEAWERFWMFYLSEIRYKSSSIIFSSNGFAAGATLEDAVRASSEELIDRAILMKAWQTQASWKPYKIAGFCSRVLSALMLGRKWDLKFYKVSDVTLGSILVGLGTHPSHGVIFDSCYFSLSKNEASVELKVVRSLLKSMSLQGEIGRDPEWTFPDDGIPMDHWIFYKNPEHQKAFHFLNENSSREGIIHLGHPELIKTETVFNGVGLPAVAASYHPDWLPLRWGKNSISGANPWPHPLA